MSGMSSEFGDLIRRERTSRGWDQAELALRLGNIGQQTVSRWERGGSRPRRNVAARLAEVLELEVAEVLAAAGYPDPTADSPDQLAKPVRPRAPRLPFGQLPEDRFEEFTADLAHILYPHHDVQRFGGRGDKQYGVDVIVRRDGRVVATFQCKRHERFGPEDVSQAVAAVTIEAGEHFLMLSRPTATSRARTAIGQHPRWVLRDGDAISRIVRMEIPRDAAVRLVDTYFPGWREDFLGVASPSPWLTPDEFFRPFSGEQLFTHDWQLVGRQDVLTAIIEMVVASNDNLGVLVGRGGAGKTRLLRAVADGVAAHESFNVRFLATSGHVRAEDFELLPPSPLLVVVDDAHHRSDIADLLSGISRNRPDATVLLSVRPYGSNILADSARQLGVYASALPRWELTDLSLQEAEALVREVLGSDANALVVRRLASLAPDCPLIPVLGAGLHKRGRLDLTRLESDQLLREEILGRFRDAVIGNPATGDVELRRALTDALAILQPVRLDQPDFRDALESFTGVPFDRLMPHLRTLEQSGVLLRRGQSIRIVPDMLGDVILAQASIDDASGVSTGYVERARLAARGDALRNLFVNASRLRRQSDQNGRSGFSPIDALWNALGEEFRAADIGGRLSLLELVKKVSYYQPERALAIARWAIDNPTDAVDNVDSPLARLYRPTYANVLHELGPVVKYCAYTVEHLRNSMDILWELAQVDERPPNQHPEHPLRVLTELAQWESTKPPQFNEAVLSAAERWFDEDGSTRSPFDVIDALLATEGSDHYSDGRAISFRPYALNVDVVRAVRSRVVALALAQARHRDVKRAVRAVKTIGNSLHYPLGMFGRTVGESERAVWTPVFVDTINQLCEVAQDPCLDPIVCVAIREAVDWHAMHATGDTRASARDVIARLPQSTEHRLALLLYDAWGHLGNEHPENYEDAERKRDAHRQAVAEMAADLSDVEIIDMLRRRIEIQARAFEGKEGSPGRFVWTLIETRPSVGEAICALVQEVPTSVLTQLIPVVLAQIAEHSPDRAVPLARGLIASRDLQVLRCIALAFGWNRGSRTSLLDGEADLLREFAVDDDVPVRRSVAHACRWLVSEQRAEVIDLLSRIRFADSRAVADDVMTVFGLPEPLCWEEFPPAARESFVAQLLECPAIDGYEVNRFLATLSRVDPDTVIALMKDRVERAAAQNLVEYQPLPTMWHVPLQFRSHDRFDQFLRDLRNWIASDADSWHRGRYGADLFRAVSGPFDDAVIAILDEVLASGEENQLEAVAAILREAPTQIVWDNTSFVRRALNAAADSGDEQLQAMGAALHAATMSNGRHGTPGRPFPEDITQRDRGAEIAATLPAGSVEWHFYNSLSQSAEDHIRWSLQLDAQILDGRDW